MTKIKDSLILVTGGASGIGRLMGDLCLQDGASALIIWDINAEMLDKTTRELRALRFIVHPYVVDVSDLNQVRETAQRVRQEAGEVDILINNAGIINGNNYFSENTHEEILRTMAINANALMHVALEFLPGMIRKGRGHIVNISSAAGMLANPRMAVYCASKWAAAGFSESLRIELESMRSGVRVTTVNPSYIDTGMFAGARTSPLIPLLRPDKVARKVVRAIKTNRLFVRMPLMVRLIPFTRGILPVRIFDLIAGNLFGVYDSMKNFTGRSETSKK